MLYRLCGHGSLREGSVSSLLHFNTRLTLATYQHIIPALRGCREALSDHVPIIPLVLGEGEHTAPHKGRVVPSTRARRFLPVAFIAPPPRLPLPLLSPSLPSALFVYVITCNPPFYFGFHFVPE